MGGKCTQHLRIWVDSMDELGWEMSREVAQMGIDIERLKREEDQEEIRQMCGWPSSHEAIKGQGLVWEEGGRDEESPEETRERIGVEYSKNQLLEILRIEQAMKMRNSRLTSKNLRGTIKKDGRQK